MVMMVRFVMDIVMLMIMVVMVMMVLIGGNSLWRDADMQLHPTQVQRNVGRNEILRFW